MYISIMLPEVWYLNYWPQCWENMPKRKKDNYLVSTFGKNLFLVVFDIY